MNQIYQDENQQFQFDFSSALWATDELHAIYRKNNANILSDVDFIAETEENMLLVEYKNAKIPGAVHPELFNPFDQKRENKIAFKYYDSWIYLSAIQKCKPVKYIYILEYPNDDSVMRKRIRNRIADLLPFELQKLPGIKIEMIQSFEVLSISEWNVHRQYKKFPIIPVNPIPQPGENRGYCGA